MLSQTRRTAFILAFTFLLTFLIGSAPIFFTFSPGSAPQLRSLSPDLSPIGSIFFGLAFLVIASYLVSRSPLLNRLGKGGFGGRGLARWAACGLLCGLLFAFLNLSLTRWLGEQSAVRPILEVLADIGAFGLVYWLVFRRSVWFMFEMPPAVDTKITPARPSGVVFLLIGALLLAGALLLYMNSPRRDVTSVFLSPAIALGGLGTLLTGLSARMTQRNLRMILSLVGLVLIIFGLSLGALGLALK